MKDVLTCLAFACVIAVAFFCRFPQLKESGDGVFYDAQDSTAHTVSAEQGTFGGAVKAESFFIREECDLNALLKKYRARVVFKSFQNGMTEYYCYSFALCGGLRVNGQLVNLHVAVAEYGYSVGTPLIFGGY